MNASLRKRRYILAVIAAVAPDFSAQAQGGASISGDYQCAYGCRMTDAAPSVEIDGGDAACMNEFGGVYHGRLLSDGSLSCFGKLGKLLGDGATIQWDDGVVWKRPPKPARH